MRLVYFIASEPCRAVGQLMVRRTGFQLMIVIGLCGFSSIVRADPATVAAAIQGEDAECRYLVSLCRDADTANTEAKNTSPATAGVDVAMRRLREALAKSQDAIEAAKVIRAKDGKDPKCLSEPECAFIKGAPAYGR